MGDYHDFISQGKKNAHALHRQVNKKLLIYGLLAGGGLGQMAGSTSMSSPWTRPRTNTMSVLRIDVRWMASSTSMSMDKYYIRFKDRCALDGRLESMSTDTSTDRYYVHFKDQLEMS